MIIKIKEIFSCQTSSLSPGELLIDWLQARRVLIVRPLKRVYKQKASGDIDNLAGAVLCFVSIN